MGRRLRTLALAGLAFLSACAHNQKAVPLGDPPRNNIDKIIQQHHQELTKKPLYYARTNPPIQFRSSDETNYLPALYKKIYGLEETHRQLYLITELARTITARDITRNTNKNLEKRIAEQQETITALQNEPPIIEYKTIRDTVSLDIEQITRNEKEYPVPEQQLFLRLGNNYYVLPTISLLCQEPPHKKLCVHFNKIGTHK